MRKKELLFAARKLGDEHGKAAASWYFDGNTDDGMYAKVLKGIEDGDPAIYDTFPSEPLRGTKLFEEIYAGERQVSLYGDDLVQTYEFSYEQALQDEIERMCRYQLRKDVTFTISVTTDGQDPEKLLSELTDLLAKMNCELLSEEVEED